MHCAGCCVSVFANEQVVHVLSQPANLPQRTWSCPRLLGRDRIHALRSKRVSEAREAPIAAAVFWGGSL